MTPNRTDIALFMPRLKDLASRVAKVLELGCAEGDGSTRALAQGLELSAAAEKCMVSVDIEAQKPDIERPQQEWWHKVTGNTRHLSTLEEVWAICPAFDLIFIDTDHNYAQMKTELELWSEVSTRKTVWLFHDTWMMGQYNPMTDAIKEFAAEHWLSYKDLSYDSHGLGWMGPREEE